MDYEEETGREWVHVRSPETDFGVHELLMVQGESGNADNQPGGVQHVRGQDGGELEAQERGAKAIRFPMSVPTAIASSLRRLRHNLGHPSTSDFVRHLRLAGATREVLKAAKSLTCQTCQRTKGPGAPKTGKDSLVLALQRVDRRRPLLRPRRKQRHAPVPFHGGFLLRPPRGGFLVRKDTQHIEKTYCES